MAETAAHLVDHVIPVVPVRQWVLSIPFALRYRLAYDSSLLSDMGRSCSAWQNLPCPISLAARNA